MFAEEEKGDHGGDICMPPPICAKGGIVNSFCFDDQVKRLSRSTNNAIVNLNYYEDVSGGLQLSSDSIDLEALKERRGVAVHHH